MPIGVFFLLLGSSALAVALTGYAFGTPALLAFVWPALSFLWVGTAYLRSSSNTLRKRSDGSLPLLVVVLLLPYFLLTWGLWYLIRLGRERCCDEITPGVFLGRRPLVGELPSQVTLVVDMTAEFPRPPGLPPSVSYRCLPTLDGFVPDQESCRRLVQDLASHTGPVYVHCAQGHGRSAVVVGALLVAKKVAADAAEAEATMKAIRPGVHLSTSQRQLLSRLARALT